MCNITREKLLAAVPGGVLQGNVTLHLTRVGGHLLQNLCRPEAELTQTRGRGWQCLFVYVCVCVCTAGGLMTCLELALKTG